MNSSSKLNKIKRTRINVLLNKALKKAYSPYKNKIQRNEDLKTSSYSNSVIDLSDFFLPFDIDIDFLRTNSQKILQSADHALNHEFRLFTKDHIQVDYNISPNGREKYKYIYDFSIEKAIYNINSANKDDSKKLRDLISSNYKPIDWQLDWVSGYRWSESIWYGDIRYGYNKGADIKQVWELGRMHELLHLAFAFVLTKQENYKKEFKDRILDFYSMNPPRFGVQWKSSMDVSIRAINCLFAYKIFEESNSDFDHDFRKIFSNFLLDHIKHIYKNIEFAEGQRGNHYLTNICSLVILTSVLPNDKLSLIQKRSLKSFIKELKYQFLEDGGNFESSIPYHLLTCEIINTCYLFIKKNLGLVNFEFFPKTINKIHSINSFLVQNMHERYLPRIGDDDSGRYLNLFPFIHRHYNGLNTTLNILQDEFRQRNQEQLYLEYKELKSNGIKSYKTFGISIFRNFNYELSLSHSKLGQRGKGGHDHNDRLSFVMSVNGFPFIVDPGTYNYTGIWRRRNQFRSVKYHNTLVLEGQEQNKWDFSKVDDLFWMQKDDAKPGVLEISQKCFEAYQSAYEHPHIRKIIFFDNKIECQDSYNSNEKKMILFHLYPNLNIQEIENGLNISSKNFNVNLISNDGKFQINKFLYSPVYGTYTESKRIVLVSNSQNINWEIQILEH